MSRVEEAFVHKDEPCSLCNDCSHEASEDFSIEHHIRSHSIYRPYLRLLPGVVQMLPQNPLDLPSIYHVLSFIEVHDSVHDELCCDDFSFEMLESFLYKLHSNIPHIHSHDLLNFSLLQLFLSIHYIMAHKVVQFLRTKAKFSSNFLWLELLYISHVHNFSHISKEISSLLSAWLCYLYFALKQFFALELKLFRFFLRIFIVQNCILLQGVNFILDCNKTCQ
ncbi:MAG: hypothetical protein IPK55_10915 [Streptococcus sp.]|nr:hypothetical protein [Streptococcus sp.]